MDLLKKLNTLFIELALYSFEIVVVLLLTSMILILVLLLLEVPATHVVLLLLITISWFAVTRIELLSVLIHHH